MDLDLDLMLHIGAKIKKQMSEFLTLEHHNCIIFRQLTKQLFINIYLTFSYPEALP